MTDGEMASPLDELNASGSTLKPGNRTRALPYAIALLTVILTQWTIDIAAPALPAIKSDLGLSAAGAGLIFSLMFLGRLVGTLPASFMLERYGAAWPAMLGAALLTAGSIIAASANSEATLYPARFVQGAGASLLVNAGLRSILKAKPGQGAAMTYFGFCATVGGVFGLESGGFLTDHSGWRAVFTLSAVIGAVLIAASMIGLVWARRPGIEPTTVTAVTEQATSSWRQVTVPLFINLLVFANYGLWVVLPLYTEQEFGVSSQTNANLLLVITLVHLVAVFPVGRLIRRWGSSRTLLAGMLLATVGTLLILPAPSPVWLIPPLILYGVGQVAAVNAGGDMVLQRCGLSGKAVGYVRLTSDLGLVIAPFAIGALADAFGYRAPLVAMPAMMVAAILVVLSQQRSRGAAAA